jgi:hypothetical protein
MTDPIQKLADQIWDSLRAYAATLVFVPNPRADDDERRDRRSTFDEDGS